MAINFPFGWFIHRDLIIDKSTRNLMYRPDDMLIDVDIINWKVLSYIWILKQVSPVMNRLFWRTSLILAHAIANFILISMLFRYDITGSWLLFFGFIIIALVLFYLFVRHLVSYIYFIKKIKT
jgi:hypothetical protein